MVDTKRAKINKAMLKITRLKEGLYFGKNKIKIKKAAIIISERAIM